MLSLGRHALQSPLPRGLSPWGSLNSPTLPHSMTVSSYNRLEYLDNSTSPVSSRPETPTLIPRWPRTGRNGSGAGAVASTVIESWGSGGVMLETFGKLSPTMSPRTREDYGQSIFGIDSRGGSPRSPSLNRKKGSLSLIRLRGPEDDVPMRIKSQKSLEQAEFEEPKRESIYRSPTVENVDDAFFTGCATPEPPPMGNGGEIVRKKSRERSGYIRGPPPLTQEQRETRRPSTIPEDVPDCYTPTPSSKGPKALPILEPQDDDLDGTTAATKHWSTEKESSSKSAASPSTLLRLKYPSSHHATIEIQHREGIRITTSGRNREGSSTGGSRISIQVDMDSPHGAGYTSTIRTGGKRGAMSVTVRPSSKSDGLTSTAAITPSSASKHHPESGAEDGEEEEQELIVATPPSAARKPRPRSNRHSHSKSEKHRSITPPRHPSFNLIDLSCSSGGSDNATPEMWKTVRKMEKSDDLKRESASGSRIHSALMANYNYTGEGGGWSLLDRPISLQKRTSTANGYGVSPLHPTIAKKDVDAPREVANDLDLDDDNQTVWSNPDNSPTPRIAGKKPRPLSNSNVPVEVALTMGFRGVSGPGLGVGAGSQSCLAMEEEPPIPGMVPVLPPNCGIGIMGMEEMAGGWI